MTKECNKSMDFNNDKQLKALIKEFIKGCRLIRKGDEKTIPLFNYLEEEYGIYSDDNGDSIVEFVANPKAEVNYKNVIAAMKLAMRCESEETGVSS